MSKVVVVVKCLYCDEEKEILTREYKRQLKRGREKNRWFCNSSCSMRYSHHGVKTELHDAYFPFRVVIKRLKSRKDKTCDLDVQFLKELWELQEGRCAYSGISMDLPSNSAITPVTGSPDRIDSSVGYVKGNVQFICVSLNYAKYTWTEEVFLGFLDVLVENMTSHK